MQTLNPKYLLVNLINQMDASAFFSKGGEETKEIFLKEIGRAIEVTEPMKEAFFVKLSPISSIFDTSFNDLAFNVVTNKLLCTKHYDMSIVVPGTRLNWYGKTELYQRTKSISIDFQKSYEDFSNSNEDIDLGFLFRNPKLLEKIQKYDVKIMPDMIKTFMLL